MIARYYLMVFYVLFVLYLGVKSVVFHIRHTNPSRFLTSTDGREKGMWLVVMGCIVVYGLLVGLFFVGVNPLEVRVGFDGVFSLVGMVLSLLGFVLMVKAHHDMGKAWRMGVDKENDILVGRGLFKVSRNPVYLSVFLFCFGLVLIIRSLVALLLFLLVVYLFGLIVRMEERYLSGAFGKKYQVYVRRVPRFL